MSSTELTTDKPKETGIKALLADPKVSNRLQEILGKNPASFAASVIQIANSNELLKNADPQSILNCALVAATLNLPLNNQLGFAYIVPYNQKQKDGSYKQVAQFQLGYKGYKQLALRTGQFLGLNVSDVREGELRAFNRLTGEMDFAWIEDFDMREKLPIVGYVSHFRLANGYSQTFYMTLRQMQEHAKKYSQTFKKGYGLWKDDFESMAMKTVTRLNLSKNAPLSVEMQKAHIVDHGIINDENGEDVTYADNEVVAIDHEEMRIEDVVEQVRDTLAICETIPDVNKLEAACSDEVKQLMGGEFNAKREELVKE